LARTCKYISAFLGVVLFVRFIVVIVQSSPRNTEKPNEFHKDNFTDSTETELQSSPRNTEKPNVFHKDNFTDSTETEVQSSPRNTEKPNVFHKDNFTDSTKTEVQSSPRYTEKPYVFHKDNFTDNTVTEVIFVLANTKRYHLAAFLRSLARSDLPRNATIVFSVDSKDTDLPAQAELFKLHFANAHVWYYPHSCDAEPGGFPRYVDGSEYFDWAPACARLHWWYSMNRVWASFTKLELVIYLDEDFVLAKNFYSVSLALRHRALSLHLLGFMLACRENLWTVTGGMLRAMWLLVKNSSDFYCTFNDYNYDLALKQTILQNHVSSAASAYVCPEGCLWAMHAGVVGKGINFGVHVPDVNDLRAQIITLETTFYAKTDECPAPTRYSQHALYENNTGQGHFSFPVYHQFCKDISLFWDT